MSQYGNLLYSVEEYSKPNWTPTRTEMGDPSKLAQSLGVTYDYDSILGKFNDVTKAQMDLAKKQQTHSENKYYSDMYNTQMSSLDTIKKANAQAVATGASRGMQAANELSSILGLQQESVAGATDLAAARSELIDKEREAYATNALNALQQANNTALSLGNLNANIYATDTQFDVGQMDYYARLDAAMKQLMAAQEQANGNRYAADQNLAGMQAQANAQIAAAQAAASGGGYGSGSTEVANTTDAPMSREEFVWQSMRNGSTYEQALTEYKIYSQRVNPPVDAVSGAAPTIPSSNKTNKPNTTNKPQTSNTNTTTPYNWWEWN